MRTLEIARRLIQLGEIKEACKACYLVLHESDGSDPAEELEAAMCLLKFGSGDDYKVSYQTFCRLYNSGFCKEDILQIMDEAFYVPNIKLFQTLPCPECETASAALSEKLRPAGEIPLSIPQKLS